MKQLIPLEQSAQYDGVEAQLKALTISLWQMYLAPAARDVDVSAAPHFGSKELMLKNIKSDGLASFNTASLDTDNARYLLLAERHKNQKRGLHFLRTFIKCTWGSDFEVHQLWQKKDGEYPIDTMRMQEMLDEGVNRNDYFLTSRLAVELNGNVRQFPNDISSSLRATLPARLFVSDVFRRVTVDGTLYFGDYAEINSSSELYSDCVTLEVNAVSELAFNDYAQVLSIDTLTLDAH